MTDVRTATLIVEPDPGGHHFQAAAAVASIASHTGPVVLLTGRGATDEPSFATYLGDHVARGAVVAHEVFDVRTPAAGELIETAAAWCRDADVPVATIVVMDADQALKRWWIVAPRHLRGLHPRPRVVFMLTRYPARLALNDLTSWRLRGPKAVLTAAAMLTGSLHRAAGFSGREDTATGWLVKRVRDPHYASAHSRDRDRWREELGLPADRRLVGIFGALEARKNPALVFAAMQGSGLDADLVLAGGLDDEVRAWVASLDAVDRARVIVRDEFLTNDELDRFVAAVDVVPLALTNNGPSGIMGKAAAAGVPVVTAGSRVRAREATATGTGVACELTVEGLGAAMREVLEGPFRMPLHVASEEITADDFAMALLGVDAVGAPR